MTVKAVFFDLDGTLIDSLPSISATFKAVRRKMDMDFPLELPLSLVGIPLIDIARETVGVARTEEFLRYYADFYGECCQNTLVLFPGIADLLRFLFVKQIKMAIITSKRITSTSSNLKLLDIAQYFDTVVTPELLQHPKPDPEAVLLALEKTATAKEEALMVGDTYYDIAAGVNAGVGTIAVTWGNYDEIKLFAAKPNHVVNSVPELKALIASLL